MRRCLLFGRAASGRLLGRLSAGVVCSIDCAAAALCFFAVNVTVIRCQAMICSHTVVTWAAMREQQCPRRNAGLHDLGCMNVHSDGTVLADVRALALFAACSCCACLPEHSSRSEWCAQQGSTGSKPCRSCLIDQSADAHGYVGRSAPLVLFCFWSKSPNDTRRATHVDVTPCCHISCTNHAPAARARRRAPTPLVHTSKHDLLNAKLSGRRLCWRHGDRVVIPDGDKLRQTPCAAAQRELSARGADSAKLAARTYARCWLHVPVWQTLQRSCAAEQARRRIRCLRVSMQRVGRHYGPAPKTNARPTALRPS